MLEKELKFKKMIIIEIHAIDCGMKNFFNNQKEKIIELFIQKFYLCFGFYPQKKELKLFTNFMSGSENQCIITSNIHFRKTSGNFENSFKEVLLGILPNLATCSVTTRHWNY